MSKTGCFIYFLFIYLFFITIVFYNFFMERCTQISRLRDNKVLLYCIEHNRNEDAELDTRKNKKIPHQKCYHPGSEVTQRQYFCHHGGRICHPKSSYVTTKLYGTFTGGCNNNAIFSDRAIFTFPTVAVCRPC